MYCSKCGNKNIDGAVFCTFCGIKITQDQSNEIENNVEENVQNNAIINLKKNTESTDNTKNLQVKENNNLDTVDTRQFSQYHKEYLFLSRDKGKDLEIGPFKIAEGYKTKTNVVVDYDSIHLSQNKLVGENKQKSFKVKDISAITYGYSPYLLMLIVVTFFVAAFAFEPTFSSMVPLLRVVFVIILGLCMIPSSGHKISIISVNDKMSFESKWKEFKKVREFINDIRVHPQYKGKIEKEKFLIKKILLASYLIFSLVLIIKPNPFVGSKLYDGKYEEWASEYFPDSCRTLVAIDVSFAKENSESNYDCINALTGDDFDTEIWLTNENAITIGEWKWLQNATSVIGNYAVFNITLTKIEIDNDNFSRTDKIFVVTDPVALSEKEFYQKYYDINIQEPEINSVNMEKNINESEANNINTEIGNNKSETINKIKDVVEKEAQKNSDKRDIRTGTYVNINEVKDVVFVNFDWVPNTDIVGRIEFTYWSDETYFYPGNQENVFEFYMDDCTYMIRFQEEPYISFDLFLYNETTGMYNLCDTYNMIE